MKHSLTFFLTFLFFLPLVHGQDFIYDPDKNAKSDVEVYAEGEGREKKKLLLISYKPVMHVPDPAGDMELLMKSGRDLKKLYNRIRQALDVSMSEKFGDGFTVTSLLRANDSTKVDLDRIYGVASYNYEDRPVEVGEQGKLGKINLGGSNKKQPSRDVDTKIRGGQLSSRDIDRSKQYMNVSIPDKAFIAYLSTKYDADILMFVNQFELRKTFAQGEDVAYGKYSREVKVHYSVYDGSGLQLYGNSSVDRIGEKQDNINEIIAKTFPNISADVYDHIPGAHQSGDAQKLDKKYEKKAENQDILRKKD
ncbi:MAG: hypothetical protein JKY18_01450 [Flavobacteriales bacterium]|nr:hypothetical protein [Flavobacteriales bacterium]